MDEIQQRWHATLLYYCEGTSKLFMLFKESRKKKEQSYLKNLCNTIKTYHILCVLKKDFLSRNETEKNAKNLLNDDEKDTNFIGNY